MTEKVSEANSHSPKRWATGIASSSYSTFFFYYMAAIRISAVRQTMPKTSDAKWTGRWIDAYEGNEKKVWNLDLGSFEVGDGGYGVMEIEEHEKQVPVKGGRTRRGQPHEARTLIGKIVQV